MAIEYSKIESVNKRLVPMDIKGKNYNTVNQRVLAFHEIFPEGRIITELVSLENGVCLFRAHAYDGDTELATGTAMEKESSSYINKTSYVENCETSAVGRALGLIGIGAADSIASAEEVGNAIKQQEDIKKAESTGKQIKQQEDIKKAESTGKQRISKTKADALKQRCQGEGVKTETILGLYKVKSFSDLTENQHANICQNWERIKAY